MDVVYSRHFRNMLYERRIEEHWVKRVLSNPEKKESRIDGTEHFLGRIPERENRWLRVIVNTTVRPNRAVTVFFDRRAGPS